MGIERVRNNIKKEEKVKIDRPGEV